MNIKKLNEEIEKILESNNPILDEIKDLYPQDMQEDLTDEYIDIVIDELESVLRPEELDKYKETLKISRRVNHSDNYCYMQYLVHGYYGEDRIISGRLSLSAKGDGNNETNEVIFSGFTRNPIGQIEKRYSFNPRFMFANIETIVEELTQEMVEARKQSLKADQAYIDYVKETGDLS